MNQKLEALRAEMRKEGINAYLVPTADFHGSEYVGDYFKCRAWLTGFTGSAGTALVMAEEAFVWTDGRYFVQAAEQLQGSGFTLMKSGEEGVPTLSAYLKQHMPEGGVLGFDGRVVNSRTARRYKEELFDRKVTLRTELDLVGRIWADRPARSAEPVWILSDRYTGQSAADRIAMIQQEMRARHASLHLLSCLDDIVWLLNIRGGDVLHNPVVLSYLLLTDGLKKENGILFLDPAVINEEVRTYLTGLGLQIRPYETVLETLQALKEETILLETGMTSHALVSAIGDSNLILDFMNPESLKKAIKTGTEQENERRAHLKDAVAMVRFIRWLKEHVGKGEITEVSAADYLDHLRSLQEGNLGLSFDTISAYGSNAAIVHYHPDAEHNALLKPRGLYLVDSGGQYLEGTTDITRTIALGPTTDEEKDHYTLVLMGMLRLGHARFLYGCSGLSLDYIAREPLWQRGLNFNHGTGHGVG